MGQARWNGVAGSLGVALLAVLSMAGGACSSGGEPEEERTRTVSQAIAPDTLCVSAVFNGNTYWFCNNLRNWSTARSKCEAVGQNLVRIDSAAENTFIKTQLNLGLWLKGWIGANDTATEGTWRWSFNNSQFWTGAAPPSGVPFPGMYSNWGLLSPDNLFNDDCAKMLPDGVWADEVCSGLDKYICETGVDLCPNDPQKVEPGVCGCGVPDVDTDGDGTLNCLEQCPLDPGKITPGDCGCSNTPQPAGTPCDDGICPANNQCNGAGRCGTPAQCMPEAGCTLATFQSTPYWFCDVDTNFATARQRCLAVGMDLVAIETTGEDAFVTSIIDEHVWIGSTDAQTQGDWKWLGTDKAFWSGGSSGGPVSGAYTNWEQNNPDFGIHGDCAAKDPPLGGGKWENFDCSSTHAYVCERMLRAGEGCQANNECAAGLICGVSNGVRFGLPENARVCWDPQCVTSQAAIGCGREGAPCGKFCSDRKPCTANSDCPAGQVCGSGNGPRFNALEPDVCWAPGCETNPVATGCGNYRATCGVCPCESECSTKSCGDDPRDSCFGICPGLCADREAGCHSDLECQPGSVCIIGGGPRIGLPANTNVCLPGRCASPALAAPDCGTTSSVCGTCEACVPDCTGRVCGPDPNCGTECGSDCNPGSACTGEGQCVPVVAPTPPLIPDGSGGLQPLPPMTLVPTSPVGALAGEFEVTDEGDATYTIPIMVPPGRAGMQPALALAYSSRGGSGALGVGWSLEGISMISRCPATVASDGFSEPVRVGFPETPGSTTGRFCLDGQRLVSIPGTMEFRTEIESFAKIVAVGSSITHPNSFRVFTRDSRILDFGLTDNAKIHGIGATRAWALSKVSDRAGNSMSITYMNRVVGPFGTEVATTELLPNSIIYASFNAGGTFHPADRFVRFLYEQAPNPVKGFSLSGPVARTQLLGAIETWVQGRAVRKYILGYQHHGSGQSRLMSVAECAVENGDVCKPPTQFTYRVDAANEPDVFEEPIVAGDPVAGLVLDVDANGRSDVAVSWATIDKFSTPPISREAAYGITITAQIAGTAVGNPEVGQIAAAAVILINTFFRDEETFIHQYRKLYRGTGVRNAPFQEIPVSPPPQCTGLGPGRESLLSEPQVTDHEGDSLQQILDVCPVEMELNTNQPFPPRVEDYPRSWFFDFDGDGRTDKVECDPNADNRMLLSKSNGAILESPPLQFPAYGAICEPLEEDPSSFPLVTFERSRPPSLLIDFDGDGVLNLLVFDKKAPLGSRWAVLRTTRPAPTWETQILSGPIDTDPNALMLSVADMNGDGIDDILSLRTRPNSRTPDQLWYGTGGTYLGRPLRNDSSARIDDLPWAMDLDKNQRDDIVHLSKASGTWLARNVTEAGELTLRPVFSPALAHTRAGYYADLNGDGYQDLITRNETTPDLKVQYGKRIRTDLLTSVTDGEGKFFSVDYDVGIEGESIYQPGTGCTWPQRCLPFVSRPLVSILREGRNSVTSSSVLRRVQYHYFDGRADVAGGGWIGFGRRAVSESDGNGTLKLQTIIDYDNTTRIARNSTGQWGPPSNVNVAPHIYINAGRPTSMVEQFPSTPSPLSQTGFNQRINSTTFSWETRTSSTAPAAQSRPFALLRQKTTTARDFGTQVMSEVETFDSDGFGNDTLYDRVGQDAFRVDTIFYPPNQTAWLIGLPERAVVTSTRNGATTRTTRFEFTPSGLPFKTIREPGDSQFELRTTLVRGNFNNVERIDLADALGHVRSRTIGYDPTGTFPTSATNALSQKTEVRFESKHGQISDLVDANGNVRRFGYDGFGRPTAIIQPEGSASIAYQDAEPSTDVFNAVLDITHRTVMTIAGGPEVQEEFDALGRMVRRISTGYFGQPVHEEFHYTWDGQLALINRPHLAGDTSQGRIRRTFDGWDRVILEEHPDGAQFRYEYTSRALLKPEFSSWVTSPDAVEVIRTTDALTHSNVVALDSFELPTTNVDAAGNRSDYTYGPFNQLRQVRDAKNALIDIHSDRYDRVFLQRDPALGDQQYTYTPFDELETHTDSAGRTTTHFYDALGRVRRTLAPEGETTFVYDGPNAIGRLVESISPSGQRIRYEYEAPTATRNRGLLERVVRTIDGEEFPTRFEYDSHSRLEVLHYPSIRGEPFAIRYTYDDPPPGQTAPRSGNMLEVRNALTSELFVRVDESFQGLAVRRQTFGTGVFTVRDFKPLTGELEHLVTSILGSTRQELSYEYDFNGNMTRRRDHLGSQSIFGYDGLNRLKSENAIISNPPAVIPVRAFDYDAAGNITSNSDLGTYTYPDPARPYMVTQAGGITYGYDPSDNGNIVSRSGPGIPSGEQHIAYTSFNLPSSITTGSGQTATTVDFDYDAGLGRVIKRDSASSGQKTVYAGDLYRRSGPIGTGIQSHRYVVYGPEGTPISEVVRLDDGTTLGAPARTFIHADHLGSSQTVTDSNGAGQSQLFAPFGAAANTSGVLAGFTGHEHDSELGLINMRGRLYDPLLGRFLTADPFVQAPFWTQGLNRYSYTWNNPLGWVDPSGFQVDPRIFDVCVGPCQTNESVSWSYDGGGGSAGSGAGSGSSFPLSGPGIIGVADVAVPWMFNTVHVSHRNVPIGASEAALAGPSARTGFAPKGDQNAKGWAPTTSPSLAKSRTNAPRKASRCAGLHGTPKLGCIYKIPERFRRVLQPLFKGRWRVDLTNVRFEVKRLKGDTLGQMSDHDDNLFYLDPKLFNRPRSTIGAIIAHEVAHVRQSHILGGVGHVTRRINTEPYSQPPIPRDRNNQVDMQQLNPVDRQYNLEGIADTVQDIARDLFK